VLLCMHTLAHLCLCFLHLNVHAMTDSFLDAISYYLSTFVQLLTAFLIMIESPYNHSVVVSVIDSL
jgi:hypothetical protein